MFGRVRKKKETYGFIRGEDGEDYIFVPSGFQQMTGDSFDNTGEGARVEFESAVGPKGGRAFTIRKVK